ncbi:MAG: cytidine deaminase [Elusimicrobia bacterium]|nr:cytidine deaminase [Elusimicrobiota bacterium]
MISRRQVQRLVAAALAARRNAYCPYSRYPVGAAVLTSSGRIFAGCNVENASYGLTLCAERVAMASAIVRRQTELKAACIVGQGARPCGACRQFLFEFSTPKTELYLVDVSQNETRPKITRGLVRKMLPWPFDPLASGLLSRPPKYLQGVSK